MRSVLRLNMYVKGPSHCANPRASATRRPTPRAQIEHVYLYGVFHATLRNTRQLHARLRRGVLRAGVLRSVAECCAYAHARAYLQRFAPHAV